MDLGMDEWMDGWMDLGMDEWMDGWMDGGELEMIDVKQQTLQRSSMCMFHLVLPVPETVPPLRHIEGRCGVQCPA